MLEVQCPPGQVPHANRANPKQPRLHGHCRRLQTGMFEALSNRASIPLRFVANYSSTPLDPPMNRFSCFERLRNISYSGSHHRR